MDSRKISRIFDALYTTNLIPLLAFNNKKEMIHPLLENDISQHALFDMIFSEANQILTIINDGIIMLGFFKMIIDDKDAIIIVGPVKSPITNIEIEDKKKSRLIPMNFESFPYPVQTEAEFKEYCAFISLILLDEIVEEEEIRLKYIDSPLSFQNEKKLYQSQLDLRRIAGLTKDSYQFELSFLSYVKKGDIQKIKWVIQKISETYQVDYNPDDSSKHSHYTYIGLLTLLTRMAITEGVPLDQAFSLSDSLMINLEDNFKIQIPKAYFEHTAIEFSHLINQYKKNNKSLLTYQCIDYIVSNIDKNLNIEDIARYTGKSKSYISFQFKKDMGMTIGSYINMKKIEEAKDMLLFTNQSYLEISEILSYSSQSYFIQCFKKEVGLTPKEYRDKHMYYL